MSNFRKKLRAHAAWIFYLFELFRTEPAISSFLGTDSTVLDFRSGGRHKYYATITTLVLKKFGKEN